MGRFILRRVALSLVTLLILIVIVFLLTGVFPSDPARTIAGPFASEETYLLIRDRIGSDDPMLTQFGRLLIDTATFDFGDSYELDTPVRGLIIPALGRSALLVAFALAMTIPVSIAAGVYAARKKDTFIDRSIVTVGVSSAAIPEFVSGIMLQYFIGIQLGWFPAIADAPDGSSLLTQLNYLVLPALAILLVYFGYIARVTRAGSIEAIEADYTRTAYMKGLSTRQVVRVHILRNSLQPTVAVIGTQIGYLFGGLVALEVLFNYKGLGNLILRAAQKQDLAVLQAGIITVAIIFMIATLAADITIAWMNPRARLDIKE